MKVNFFSSSLIGASFNSNLALNFRDNVNNNTGSFGYVIEDTKKLVTSSFNSFKMIGDFLDYSLNYMDFQSRFMCRKRYS